MTEEKERRYWMGKRPSTRKAVEEYVVLFNHRRRWRSTGLWKISKEYDVSQPTIQFHLRALAKLGLYGLVYHKYGIKRVNNGYTKVSEAT